MSLFRKPKKNLRNRVEVDVNDDEENNDGIDEIHQNINKLKEKKKEKKASKNSEKPKEKKNALLSFDEELEEEDVTEFKVKKSKESRRLIKLRDKEKKEGDNKNGKSNEEDFKIVGSKNGNDKNVQIIDDDIGIVYKVNIIRNYLSLPSFPSGVEATFRVLLG